MGFFDRYAKEVRRYLLAGRKDDGVNLSADSQFADICRSYYAFLDENCR